MGGPLSLLQRYVVPCVSFAGLFVLSVESDEGSTGACLIFYGMVGLVGLAGLFTTHVDGNKVSDSERKLREHRWLRKLGADVDTTYTILE